MTRRLRSRSIQLTAGFTTMAAGILATTACTEEPPREVPTYCIAADDTIVQSDYCDGFSDDGDAYDHDSSGAVIPYWIIYGNSYPHNLQPGMKVPPGGTKITHTDQNARAAVGLPRSGGFGGKSANISSGG